MSDFTVIPDALKQGAKAEANGLNPYFTGQHTGEPLEVFQARQKLIAEVEAQAAEIARLRQEKDRAYEERNRVVAFAAKLAVKLGFSAGVRHTDIKDWDPEWHGCCYIDIPQGQLSWHFHTSQTHLFQALPDYETPYDGHTSEQKYERIADYVEWGARVPSSRRGVAP